jgi:hypothetical protein
MYSPCITQMASVVVNSHNEASIAFVLMRQNPTVNLLNQVYWVVVACFTLEKTKNLASESTSSSTAILMYIPGF